MTQYSNGKQGSEFINPAILDWYTLSVQDTAQLDYFTVATTIPQWHDTAAITDSANIRYVMTRRVIPVKSASVTANDSVSGTNTSLTEATVITNFTAALDEKLFSTLQLNGRARGIVNIGLTSSTTVAAYLSNVTVSLYKASSTGKTLLASDTVNMAVSNATTAEVIYNVPYLMTLSGQTVAPTDILYISISSTGYVASAATVTHKLYISRGSSPTYIEMQV